MVKKSYKKITVFVMMSGGVDSSVAAFLLQKQGYKVIGCFIKGYNLDGCQEKESEDARRVAEYLNIPFYTIDLEKEYKKLVVDYTVRSYKEGITPNPDVMCNKEIKFGLFFKKAVELGADYVATGHYVRLAFRDIFRGTGRLLAPAARSGLDSRLIRPAVGGGQAEFASETFRSKNPEKLASFYLMEAKDKNKDQSYFLWTLNQSQLKRCLFPI
ncbi:MAG: asparagine synthase-related protein, partial [Patescibacteria group bacterium]